MKKFIVPLIALFFLATSAAFAADACCKKCTCGDKTSAESCKSCCKDKGDKSCCSKDAKPTPSSTKKN